jgi:hypothetical protein
MEVKIRAFLAAGIRGGEVIGRNSATGSPRRSITITPPSSASRTNTEVWMWSSRTEAFLMYYIVAPADFRRNGALVEALMILRHQRALEGPHLPQREGRATSRGWGPALDLLHFPPNCRSNAVRVWLRISLRSESGMEVHRRNSAASTSRCASALGSLPSAWPEVMRKA